MLSSEALGSQWENKNRFSNSCLINLLYYWVSWMLALNSQVRNPKIRELSRPELLKQPRALIISKSEAWGCVLLISSHTMPVMLDKFLELDIQNSITTIAPVFPIFPVYLFPSPFWLSWQLIPTPFLLTANVFMGYMVAVFCLFACFLLFYLVVLGSEFRASCLLVRSSIS
jgi:hypothetical protein